jgi:hypothetical protein
VERKCGKIQRVFGELLRVLLRVAYREDHWLLGLPDQGASCICFFVLSFGFLFWLIAGQFTSSALLDNIRYSFITLFDPIAKNPGTGLFGALTVVAGFIGIYTWSVFIAALAKKYGGD